MGGCCLDLGMETVLTHTPWRAQLRRTFWRYVMGLAGRCCVMETVGVDCRRGSGRGFQELSIHEGHSCKVPSRTLYPRVILICKTTFAEVEPQTPGSRSSAPYWLIIGNCNHLRPGGVARSRKEQRDHAFFLSSPSAKIGPVTRGSARFPWETDFAHPGPHVSCRFHLRASVSPNPCCSKKNPHRQ